jgi:hypothetical protein
MREKEGERNGEKKKRIKNRKKEKEKETEKKRGRKKIDEKNSTDRWHQRDRKTQCTDSKLRVT